MISFNKASTAKKLTTHLNENLNAVKAGKIISLVLRSSSKVSHL